MANSEKKSWLREIILSVTTAGVLALFSLIPGGWTWVFDVLGAFWAHLGRASAIPHWALYLLAAAVVFTVVVLVWAAVDAMAPEWKGYVEDDFFGVPWRWRYISNQVYDPWAFCPSCDTQLVYSQTGGRFSPEPRSVTLFCERCRQDRLVHDGDRNYLVAAVKRQIDRNLRTGDWKKRTQS